MKIYITGKITGDLGYQAKFRRAAAGLRMCGHIVLNPAELPEGMTAEEYMRICFAMLDVADEMWYLGDAADSPGAFLEVQYCRYIKKRVRRFSEAEKEGKCEPHPCN